MFVFNLAAAYKLKIITYINVKEKSKYKLNDEFKHARDLRAHVADIYLFVHTYMKIQ